MNPDPARLDDPQLMCCGLGLEYRQRIPQHRGYATDALRRWSQDPDARIIGGWIASYVREIEIKRDQDTILCFGGLKNRRIRLTAQSFSEYSIDIVSGFPQQDLGVSRKVLI